MKKILFITLFIFLCTSLFAGKILFIDSYHEGYEWSAGVIDELGSITHIIASSVEEQTSTTNEISRSIAGAASGADEVSKNVNDLNIRIQNEVLKAVKEAAIGINQVSNNINGISSVTEKISGEAITTSETSSQVAVLATKLKKAVGEFKI